MALRPRCGEADKFAAHLYQSRRQYRRTCERPNKDNKAIEREVISTTRSRRALDSMATFARASQLLRIHE